MDAVAFFKQIEEKDQEALKSIQVDKHLVEEDFGHLLLYDRDEFKMKEYRARREEYLRESATSSCQYLVNKLLSLETKEVDNMVVHVLPKPTTVLPRAKPIPKPKPPTKWEEFAKLKGIKKRKKEKLVWDEATQTWKPRYGYKRADGDEKQWMVEVPDNKDPNTDMFDEMKKAKKERIAKNELQRLRNIARPIMKYRNTNKKNTIVH